MNENQNLIIKTEELEKWNIDIRNEKDEEIKQTKLFQNDTIWRLCDILKDFENDKISLSEFCHLQFYNHESAIEDIKRKYNLVQMSRTKQYDGLKAKNIKLEID